MCPVAQRAWDLVLDINRNLPPDAGPLMLGSDYDAWLDSLDPSDCGFAGEEADYSWREGKEVSCDRHSC